jgi:SP family general alpha glucoside:H+ symporter-like MFS transporter
MRVQEENTVVVLTDRERNNFALEDPAVLELITRAEQAVNNDRKLTIWQALTKYKKAVFWAMILSTALVMEGYDIVVV